MSTTILDGYRLAPGTDLFAFSQRLRDVMNPVRDRLDAALFATDATRLVDVADLAGEERPHRPLAVAKREYDREQREADPRYRWHDPHRFEASLSVDCGRGYVILHVESDAYRTAFEALPEVEEFGYWDGGDHPDDVTGPEWEVRRVTWERLLPGGVAPVESMLSMSLRGAYDPRPSEIVRRALTDPASPERLMVAEALPDPATRARERAEVMVADLLVARHGWDPVRAVFFTSRGSLDPVVEAVAACLDTTTPLIEQVTADSPFYRTVPPALLDRAAKAAARYVDEHITESETR